MTRSRRRSRVRTWTAGLLIAAGLGTLGWTAAVLLWEDPFTSAYTAYRQHSLEDAFEERVRSWTPEPSTPGETTPPPPSTTSSGATTPAAPADDEEPRRELGRRMSADELLGAARRYRSATDAGDAIARLAIPRLGLDAIVVNGTSSSDLRAGPGRHLETFMPGEQRLVYIAGHRTTYGAPFSRIDELAEGDEVRLTLPYGTLRYRVTTSEIVDDNDLSVLEPGTTERLALQACHPRFFATQRYIVWARLQDARVPV